MPFKTTDSYLRLGLDGDKYGLNKVQLFFLSFSHLKDIIDEFCDFSSLLLFLLPLHTNPSDYLYHIQDACVYMFDPHNHLLMINVSYRLKHFENCIL